MKIVFAPDKFKMCMKSSTVCRVLEKAFRTVFPDAELVSVPVSDGGEGMTHALADALHGEIRTVTVTGPDGKPVQAEFALINNGLKMPSMDITINLAPADIKKEGSGWEARSRHRRTSRRQKGQSR